MRRSILLALTCAPLLLSSACASGGVRRFANPGDPVTLTVQVRNESPDLVEVLFIGDTGARVRVGTIGPMQSDLFYARVLNLSPGYFVTRRRAALPDAAVVLQGVVDPVALRTGLVRLVVGPSGEFDRWTMGG